MVKAKWNSGFTLLEILLGVVIFSLIIGAIYSTFRAGLQMYKIGSLEKEIFQEARFLQNFSMRDLRSILAIEETYYDIPPFQFDTTDNEDSDFASDTTYLPEETTYSTSPYPFLGTVSTISFYSFGEVPLGTIRGMREAVFKVDYAFNRKKMNLVRETNELTGDIAEEEDLVHRIDRCEFSYGFSTAGLWYWVDNWDSRRDYYRKPRKWKDRTAVYSPLRTYPIRVYPDNLPDAVRIRLQIREIEDRKAEGREFEWVCEVPAAKPIGEP